MARIRTVKPEFWTDEKTGQLSPMAKCLFIGLLNLSDDYGIVEYRPSEWRVKIFPYDSDTTPVVLQKVLMEEILPTGLAILFSMTNDEACDAKKYLFISNFDKHQVVNKPSKPTLPGWKKSDTPKAYAARVGHEHQELKEPFPPAPLQEDYGSTTEPLLPGKERKGGERKGEENNNNRVSKERNGVYAFKHGCVRLTEHHLAQWRTAFPHVAVEGELIAKEPWLAKQPSWFNAAAGWLAKAERNAKKATDPPSKPKGFDQYGQEI